MSRVLLAVRLRVLPLSGPGTSRASLRFLVSVGVALGLLTLTVRRLNRPWSSWGTGLPEAGITQGLRLRDRLIT